MSLYERKFMKRFIVSLSVVILGLLFASSTQAAVVYDVNLASPDGGTTPGWYNGTGNPNGGFTVSTSNNVEIGLRAKMRGSVSVIHTPNNIYYVQPGISTGTRAWWNYEFSVNTRAGGVGTRTLGDILAEVTITDISAGTATVNMQTYWTDDTGVGAAGKHTPQVATDWGFQNSENPQFSDYPLFGAGYDVNANRTVQFDVVVKDANTLATLATDTMIVVVPEPASFSLLGLAGFGFLRRRR
jgi:hypothetical protein